MVSVGVKVAMTATAGADRQHITGGDAVGEAPAMEAVALMVVPVGPRWRSRRRCSGWAR